MSSFMCLLMQRFSFLPSKKMPFKDVMVPVSVDFLWSELRFCLRALRTLFLSITFLRSCSLTIPTSCKTAEAIAAADLSDIPNWSQTLASVGSFSLFLVPSSGVNSDDFRSFLLIMRSCLKTKILKKIIYYPRYLPKLLQVKYFRRKNFHYFFFLLLYCPNSPLCVGWIRTYLYFH